MTLSTEEKAAKPSIWNQALKVVKGDATGELVEQFTQEMTLVAEGLCEDQARLRKAVDGLIRETEGQRSKSEQDYDELLRRMDAVQKDGGKRLEELEKRLFGLEKRITALEKPAAKPKKSWFGPDMIGRVTLLAAIVCGAWVLVTILNLFA